DAGARGGLRAPARRDRPARGAPEHLPALRGRGGRRAHPSRREPGGQLRRRSRPPRDRGGGPRRAGGAGDHRWRGADAVLTGRRPAPDRQAVAGPPGEAPSRARDGGRGPGMIAIIIAGAAALLLSIVGTPLYIKLLEKRGYGQFVRDAGPTSHATKRGTPTM